MNSVPDTYEFVLKVDTDSTAPTVIHSLALYDIHRKIIHSFADQPGYQPIALGAELATLADGLVVHSMFAVKAVEKLCGVTIDRDKVVDTLAVSKLQSPTGNGLDEWAVRLHIPRPRFRGGPTWSEYVQRHCEQDARIIAALIQRLSEITV